MQLVLRPSYLGPINYSVTELTHAVGLEIVTWIPAVDASSVQGQLLAALSWPTLGQWRPLSQSWRLLPWQHVRPTAPSLRNCWRFTVRHVCLVGIKINIDKAYPWACLMATALVSRTHEPTGERITRFWLNLVENFAKKQQTNVTLYFICGQFNGNMDSWFLAHALTRDLCSTKLEFYDIW
jgi:hypothetical protein